MDKTTKERYFSVELKSKANIKEITFSNGSQENVLVEGTIGELQHAEFAEDMVLVVTGDKGIFRISLTPNDLKKKREDEEEV